MLSHFEPGVLCFLMQHAALTASHLNTFLMPCNRNVPGRIQLANKWQTAFWVMIGFKQSNFPPSGQVLPCLPSPLAQSQGWHFGQGWQPLTHQCWAPPSFCRCCWVLSWPHAWNLTTFFKQNSLFQLLSTVKFVYICCSCQSTFSFVHLINYDFNLN